MTPCSDVGAGIAAGAHGGLVEQEPWQPHDGCKTHPANTILRMQTGRQMVPHMFEEVSPPLERFTDKEEEEGKDMLLHLCLPILSSSQVICRGCRSATLPCLSPFCWELSSAAQSSPTQLQGNVIAALDTQPSTGWLTYLGWELIPQSALGTAVPVPFFYFLGTSRGLWGGQAPLQGCRCVASTERPYTIPNFCWVLFH